MNNLNTTQTNEEVKTTQPEYVPEGDTYLEQLLRAIIQAYEEGFNKHNDKLEINYTLTLTIHKVATPQGNKDTAYLRLDKHLRPKGFKPTLETPEDEGWESKLVHQELHFFKDLKERLNPNAKWKEGLYMNCLVRLTSAGLEYAELLQKLKNVEEGKKIAGITNEEEERLNKIGLVKSTEMPKAETKEDKEYKQWLATERAKEGL